jgi:hypothetical protein
MANTTVRSGWCVRARRLALAVGLLGALPAAGLAADRNNPDAKKPEVKRSSPVLGKSGDAEPVLNINKRLAEKWKDKKVTPSARASDFEFIRRASLDIIGRIATLKEIDVFLRDPESSRRALLIDRLLQTNEYAQNWANVWTVWLMTRSGSTDGARSLYHEQMHKWLHDFLKKEGASHKEMVSELLTATGKTNQNGAVNYILAHLGESSPRSEEVKEGRYTMIPVTSRSTRLFLGIQTQCAQCHDHPFNKEILQRHFWGVNAFFRQVETPRGRPPAADGNRMTTPVVLELRDDPSLNPKGLVFYEQRNGQLFATRGNFKVDHRDEGRLTASDGNRRQELARYVTESPYFAKAYVNRLWMHFFGRGFTNPVDDFHADNEPSHPELLTELAKEFEHYGHDPRRLIRWICNSDAYNLSSVASKNNAKEDAEPLFSRMLLKALTPEQLFESLMVATQAQRFQSKENRQRWMNNLTTNFGDDEGNEVTFNGTVVQALMMMNGADLNEAICSRDQGTVVTAVATRKGNLAGILDQLYKATLNRPPTVKEAAKVLGIYRTAPVRGMQRDALSFWQDLFWALLNSNEFMLNH